MSTVIINGRSMNIKGNNICITNNKVYVDGKLVTCEEAKEQVKLIIEGDAFGIKTDGDVEVTGNVNGDLVAGSNVSCGNVLGNAKSGGSMTCGDVLCNANSGGSMYCGHIGGDVKAGGSITHKRY